MECYVKIMIKKNGVICFGPGVIWLLKEIEKTGLVSEAAKNLELSYSKAWTIIRNAEGGLGETLVERASGGAKGGHSALTENAREYIKAFDKTAKEIEAFAQKAVLENFG
ncbi:winged helix-turn-helix domain-containing protein [Pleomorphochaeta sp. DL1XJH-081]|uniref:winged helix-turn-helix domain-containing protein n=1 Tax=Pleomorphochaeta sp. DL1XJH-081 TaxID=3409690 RepID=UPI003BB4D617